MTKHDQPLDIDTLRKRVATDPAAKEFIELAKVLGEKNETRAEAREVCFRALTSDSKNLRGRLLLAKLFYLDGMIEFCVRELLEIEHSAPETPALKRLLEALGDYTEKQRQTRTETSKETKAQQQDSKIIAEVSLEENFLDALDELEEE